MTMTPPDTDQPVLGYAPPATRAERASWSRQFVFTLVGIVIVTFVVAVGVFFLFSIIIDGRD